MESFDHPFQIGIERQALKDIRSLRKKGEGGCVCVFVRAYSFARQESINAHGRVSAVLHLPNVLIGLLINISACLTYDFWAFVMLFSKWNCRYTDTCQHNKEEELIRKETWGELFSNNNTKKYFFPFLWWVFKVHRKKQ